MKKFLLLALGGALAATSSATEPVSVKQGFDDLKVIVAPSPVKASHKVMKSKALPGGVSVETVASPSGFTYKRLVKAAGAEESNVIRPLTRPAARAAELPGGVSFFEGFEGCDPNVAMWLPDGWSRRDDSGYDTEDTHKWTVSNTQHPMLPSTSDGVCTAGVTFSADFLDQWLFTPEMEIKAGEELTYLAFIEPIFLTDYIALIMEGVITEAVDVEVWFIPSDGSENVELYSHFDAIPEDATYEYLIEVNPTSLEKCRVSLDAVAGRKGKLGFRYVGTDGNTILIDAIQVGLPEMDVTMMSPVETLYFGYNHMEGWGSFSLPLAVYPVYAPLTWTNLSWAEGAEYSWTFHHPILNDMITLTDEELGDESLTMTYRPDYTSEFTTRNNLYYPPTLEGIAPGLSAGTCKLGYTYFQAGGRPDWEFKDENGNPVMDTFGMLPYEHTQGGLGIYTVETKAGESPTPIFGYDKNADEFWTLYTTGGEPDPDVSAKLTAVLNFIYPSAQPLVVTGINALAMGEVGPDVEFRADIIYLTDDFEISPENTIAHGIVKGSELVSMEGASHNYLNVIVKFDTPAVLDQSHPAYVVRLTGFNSPDVEFFAPVMAANPHPEGFALSYVEKEITAYGTTRPSWSPAINYTEDMALTFTINLDAYYPWLETDTEEVKLQPEGTQTFALDTYYPAEELTVTAPQGVAASVTGRYGNSTLHVAKVAGEDPADGVIEISAPGVRKAIALDASAAGIGSVATDPSATVVGAFDLAGKPVDLDNAAAGIYLVKYSDGTTVKVAK